jgi:hypothetical protein
MQLWTLATNVPDRISTIIVANWVPLDINHTLSQTHGRNGQDFY